MIYQVLKKAVEFNLSEVIEYASNIISKNFCHITDAGNDHHIFIEGNNT
jgi:hypothetical protein